MPSVKGWDFSTNVLTTKSFPATSILRYGKFQNHTCHCLSHEKHRSLFDYLKEVLVPLYNGTSSAPQAKVCWNAENLWECKLPRLLTGLDKRLEFHELPSVWHAQKVLMEGTWWFPRLMGKKTEAGNSIHGKAVLRLISGMNKYSGPQEIWQLVSRKLSREGINKLRNILATVDGLVMQIVLSFFETEFLSWERIDQIIYCMITQLLPDYFREEHVRESDLSTFEKVKKLRKAIKMAGFNPQSDLSELKIPRELSFFKAICNMLGSNKSPLSMERIMTLSQTRASGVPPKTVFVRTQRALREVLTAPPDYTVWNTVKFYVGQGIDQLHYDILSGKSETQRERFLSRCLDRAKISLSDSGEFFTKVHEGGKLEATRKVLFENPNIEEINLETGFKTGKILNKDNSSVGDMIFHWACSKFKDRSKIYESNVMSVRVSLVSELGKYRGITVSHLAHSVLLHVASHILLEYIKEVPSSRSGVSAANHAWNFFKLLSHKNPEANFIFGNKDTYAFSTDWKDATNYCDHAVAQGMLNRTMFKLGFPTWYRQTAVFALCGPRQVEFVDDETRLLERYYTTRGVLMGDPVTKVVLHLHHIVARYAALTTLKHI
jgi:hypothetical protein